MSNRQCHLPHVHTDICYCRFVPKYFESEYDDGIPTITAEGRKALEHELSDEAEHQLEPFKVAA